ncbi:septal ring lytic transglycosylase RlpA family protein [Paraburkholderia diazotrophica]|uniref:Endolytic peptidoglycan transglycosylase RlpA n=1 Tax=Paraburkholderia diazotrophica TaxID=667676 RepID=A0A1H6ZU61_9BURK|nr:septal ring lytic transglycosylase RlpA family protein [Paraburkholderia diazotrophica]SEJ56758.1 rare lipoprotein A [Paraburkholderia diazotrophica]
MLSIRYFGILFISGLCVACAQNPTDHQAPSANVTIPDPAPITSTAASGDISASEPLAPPLNIAFKSMGSAPQSGDASWYATKFQGRRTANGERYDHLSMTAAHRTLPFGSYVRVTLLATEKSVVVRINDRGPFVKGRIIDLSYAAAKALGLTHARSRRVQIERIGKTADKLTSAAGSES